MTTTENPGSLDIVSRRQVAIQRQTGRQEWTLTTFGGDGDRLLTCNTSGIQFQAHFTREQWHELVEDWTVELIEPIAEDWTTGEPITDDPVEHHD